MIDVLIQSSLIILVLVTLLWIWSIFLKDVSIVDIFWGAGFVILNLSYYYFSGGAYTRNILLLILVSLWGLRLAGYLAWRNIGRPEDPRYQDFRRKYGPKRYWWFSYFQVFLLQAVLMIIISLPLFGAQLYTSSDSLNVFDYLALAIWLTGIIFEAGGDIQLARFKRDPANKGKVLNRGLWRYTRHPNYFGDTAVWWAYGLFSIAAGAYWQALGSVIMTLLIVRVSGVALLERSLNETKPEYREYVRNTSAFIPWFPKKSK